jgi:two-component system nitrogen regulation response regulator NtrX
MPEAPLVLIVDDRQAVREELAFALDYEGYRTEEIPDGRAALERVARGDVDAVILDVKMPGLDGLQVLERLRAAPETAELPVIMISGHGDIETAVLAVRKGAHDFLTKPLDSDRVMVSVRNALRLGALAGENAALRRELAAEHAILGESAAIQEVQRLIERAAPTEAQVLITGENGTGKELVARQLHAMSKRSRGPFVAVNCAAIPANLIESELFGHEKGAFTGATRTRAGHFEAASGGTLLLDEIGDLALEAQAKLLRALQEKVVTRVGATGTIPVDARVVAATNQDLQAMVQEKTFREDLYYRLHVIQVRVPALRDRSEDVPLLAEHFLRTSCQRNGLPRKKITPDGLAYLQTLAWPGNVRELKNAIEATSILTEGETIDGRALRDVIQSTTPPAEGGNFYAIETIEEFRAATEREFIRRKLQENGGNIKRTAERIQLQRSNLYKKLERYGLK